MPNDSSKSYLRDEALFSYQVKIIERLADQGPCVLIGRCADYILRNRPDVVRVCVRSRRPGVLRRAGDEGRFSPRKRGQKEDQRDRRLPCARYYKHHTGHDWYDARNYDLSINSGVLGFEGVVEEIVRYMEVRSEFCK